MVLTSPAAASLSVRLLWPFMRVIGSDPAGLASLMASGLVQEPAANDFEVAAFIMRARRYTGEHARPLEVQLAHEQPLLANLSGGRISVDFVAKSLAMSPATLRRRLEEEGTSQSELLDQVRRELAERYLGDAALALSEVAFPLGYSHTTGFFKAFRRWFQGLTPSEFRIQRQASGAARR